MPLAVVKGSLKYCLENKVYFLFILILFIVLEYSVDVVDTRGAELAALIISALVMGYGLQVIEDVINGGTRLPRIMPKKVVIFGIKAFIIHLVYFMLELFLLGIIAMNLDFPVFELEEFILEYNNTIMLIFNHDIVSFTIFMISGFIITYVVTFFMELSLARLADGGQLRKSFNFPRIKHAIDIIGWKNYTIGYTKIILIIVVFSHINKFFDPYDGLNIIIGMISSFMVFIVEYRGMGIVYKVYTDNKRKLGHD